MTIQETPTKHPHWTDRSVENPFPELMEWLKEYHPDWKIEIGQWSTATYGIGLIRADGPYVKYSSEEKCWSASKAPLETTRGFTTLKEALWAAIHLHEHPECEICTGYRDWQKHFTSAAILSGT